MRTQPPVSNLSIKNYRIYLSLLLGIVFGLALYSYWFIDFLPPTSRRIFLFTALAGLFGAGGYFLLLEYWIAPRFAEMKKSLRWGMIGLSILTGLFLMFAGTSAWKSLSRYVTFLLPDHSLTIRVPARQSVDNPQVVILFVQTSVGDVSYDSISYRGWKRSGDQLFLQNFADNELTWTGKVGKEAGIVFQKSPQAGAVNVTWNGVTETVNLAADKEDKYVYRRDFAVPPYASRGTALGLVAVNFMVLSCAALLWIWQKRDLLTGRLAQSIRSCGANPSSDRNSLAKLDWLILAGLILLALLLRVFNLESLMPYTDEYAHLLAAKSLLEGASLASVYARSLLMVTLPVALFLKVFGMHIWAARLAGIVFNVLAIIPLYLLTQKVNRPIAVTAGILFATNPWIIAVARNVREYAYYPFYFFWIVLGLIALLERMPGGLVLTRDWKKLFAPRISLLALILLVPVAYLAVDHYSTFKVMLINYGVMFLFLLGKLDLKNKSNLRILGLAFAAIVVGLFFFSPIEGNYSLQPGFDDYLLRYFFPNPPQQWYYDRWLLVAPILLTCAVLLGVRLYRHNFIPAFLLALFSASALFFAIFFTRYFRPRYIFNLQFWFITLLAVGGYGLWTVLRVAFPTRRVVAPIIMAGLCLLAFNPAQVILPTIYATHGLHPITDEYHDDMRAVDAYMRAHVQPGEALVTSMYGNYAQWTGTPQFSASYDYNYLEKNGQAVIYAAIAENDSGWIVLDLRRYIYSKPLPRENFVYAGRQVEYVGAYADQLVWKWSVVGEPVEP